MQGGAPGSPGKLVFPTPLDRLRSVAAEPRWGQPRGWKLLFRRGRLGELLEARIFAQRIEHRIEPEKGRGERQV